MSGNARPLDEMALVFRFGEFTFDCRSHRLLRNGVVPVHLSPKGQHLLRLLLLARPSAVSREDLYDAIWPSTYVCETNLANLVNEVRRALEDSARRSHYIRTVHGFGYVFEGAVVAAVSNSVAAATLYWDDYGYPLIEGDNVVGRAPDSSVVLTDRSVSRHHAVIRVYNGGISIHDLGSTNGTYVDGQRVGSSPVLLSGHPQIKLGAVSVSIVSRRVSSTTKLILKMPELKRRVAERTSNA